MLALTLAVTLTFNVPATEPDSVKSCVSYGAPRAEQQLTARTRFWYVTDGSAPVVNEHPVQPGTADSVTVAWDNVNPATACITLLDPAGNESCQTCIPVGPWVSDVPPNPSGPERIEWFDITGRRVIPSRPGWYVQRTWRGDVMTSRRVVILR